jgi:hypothetical protein
MLYAYDSDGNRMYDEDGNPIETSFVTTAQNDTQAAGYLSNEVTVWGQQLDDDGIGWSTIGHVLESKSADN